MKRYCIKCRAGKVEYIDILRETEEGYLIRFTRIRDGYEKTSEETMTRHLFNICLKTGYIYEYESANQMNSVA
jgi:hypothetical protein